MVFFPQNNGFRNTTSVPERTHLLCLPEVPYIPSHHRLWAQLLLALFLRSLGTSPNSCLLPCVQGAITAGRCQKQYSSEESYIYGKAGSSQAIPELWEKYMCDPPADKEDLLWGEQEPALLALLQPSGAQGSQPPFSGKGCWGIPGKWHQWEHCEGWAAELRDFKRAEDLDDDDFPTRFCMLGNFISIKEEANNQRCKQ